MVVKVYDLSVRTPVAAHRNRLIPLVPGNLYQIQGLPGMLGFLVWGTSGSVKENQFEWHATVHVGRFPHGP
jgi:hypothetical protein